MSEVRTCERRERRAGWSTNRCVPIRNPGLGGSGEVRRQAEQRSPPDCFFFQAEDGIRDDLVTGVQTCALPIFTFLDDAALDLLREARRNTGAPREAGDVAEPQQLLGGKLERGAHAVDDLRVGLEDRKSVV